MISSLKTLSLLWWTNEEEIRLRREAQQMCLLVCSITPVAKWRLMCISSRQDSLSDAWSFSSWCPPLSSSSCPLISLTFNFSSLCYHLFLTSLLLISSSLHFSSFDSSHLRFSPNLLTPHIKFPDLLFSLISSLLFWLISPLFFSSSFDSSHFCICRQLVTPLTSVILLIFWPLSHSLCHGSALPVWLFP